MQRLFVVVLALASALAVLIDTVAPAAAASDDIQPTSSHPIWKATISRLVEQPLWRDRDAYDAAHALMVPLHYAFLSGDRVGVAEFEGLFARFASQEPPAGRLTQAQWMYFVSRYLALRGEFGHGYRPVDIHLSSRVVAWLHSHWLFEPAYQYGRLPFVGQKRRYEFLAQANDGAWPASYYDSVSDYDVFLFAIAADMQSLRPLLPESDVDSDLWRPVDEVVRSGVAIVLERGRFTDEGGWLFQPGVWTDHPDFRYAGHQKLEPALEESRVPGISEDSSHSHRWPLWFGSLTRAQGIDDVQRAALDRASSGFSRQFTSKVVVQRADGVLLKNFFDGRNGVYRYRYQTVGANSRLGYGPYELSGIMGEAWYCFADGVDNLYRAYAASYPLSKEMLELYVGPNTTRERNPLFKWPEFFTNGLAELIACQCRWLARQHSEVPK
jgi:hypothetical protein